MPLLIVLAVIAVTIAIINAIKEQRYREFEAEILNQLGFQSWDFVERYDEEVVVKSRQALEKYDAVKFFKENKGKLETAQNILNRKASISAQLKAFLKDNEYKENPNYNKIADKIKTAIDDAKYYRVCIVYVTSAGNDLDENEIVLSQKDISKFLDDPTLLMSKSECNAYLKEQNKILLDKKHHQYYDYVNTIIDFANENKPSLFIKGSVEQLDNLIAQLFDRTVNSIKKIKDINSEEWDIINTFIAQIEKDVNEVVNKNKKILTYYNSPAFLKIKETCEVLMSTQREFNDYITAKVESISQLFGIKITRNETVNEDEYQYIRPYKKTITPFTAEVSATVFASAENNPLEYVIKNFYPNKSLYPEQIQRLHLLIEELSTLKEAKQIIENYKKEYQQYITDVPDYVMSEDEAGFYSRLGFAHIDENVLTVEYTFCYTSNGGMAKRKFTVPMTEETIIGLIKALEAKLTISAFSKEQRALMTNKLRDFIKNRDNFTCCSCGNSTHSEPNLLLEIDHIIPVSKGGCTVEDNLQTLCWKCNRTKSNKITN